MNMSLRFIKHKGKSYVMEQAGNCTFKYAFDPINLKCQCGQSLCKHIQQYYELNTEYLNVLTIPALREKLTPDNHTTGARAKAMCNEYLSETKCIICLGSLVRKDQCWSLQPSGVIPSIAYVVGLHQCPQCREIYHNKCLHGWHGGCPKCRHQY